YRDLILDAGKMPAVRTPPSGRDWDRRRPAGNPASAALHQLDAVAIGVFDKGDDRAAMRHRAGRTRDLDPGGAELLARLVDIGHADCEMTKGAAEIVGLGLFPVVGQLDHRRIGLLAVADKGKGELAGRVVTL